ncbi:Na+/H+ antiporter NhaC family protein [Virgibacillus sp. MSP4-1]|uniref:Na+/H+ antiporter NhaC family protein n=1 Tax=Virgibacillus sp. MSP4-1 TaxID=2700081 RepID=UPI00039E422E|nr:Na+/H+ antiporter NhaC family protein [Virgibacillus sp. MSP4-1]QHS23623.1 Na+/H+ antiporter NhaC family protein [Virgibacillus sp. MSP4-1]
MEETIYSLIPPIIAIVMVLLTRRVLISLGIGILSAGILLSGFQFKGTVSVIWESFKGVFVDGGSLNTWNVYILLFILMLGILTAFVSMMGGSRAFGAWMIRRVRSRVGAQIMTMIFGVIIFIDDYFNSLTVGQVSRPMADQHRISRAKLSYIIDSTAAPVCVVSPVSSWGAYIIGILGTVFAAEGLTEISAFNAFIQMIPMNLYVWAALGVVLVIALRKVDFGPMKKHEERAVQTGEVVNPEFKDQIDTESKLPSSEQGKVRDLMLPIIVLFVATVGAMVWTGYLATEEAKTLVNIFGNADVTLSLIIGGASGLVLTFALFFAQQSKHREMNVSHFLLGLKEGTKSMMSSIMILVLAWSIVTLIDQLGTGTYLAGLVEGANLNAAFLPGILFVIAGFIAFSTGTSWGSFGILLPIAGQIASATDVSLIMPMLAAVLAGAVFGDHCSPISDTTILSATGSSCHHIDHVMTQIPYALSAAVITFAGYMVFGLTNNTWMGLGTVLIGLLVFYFLLQRPEEVPVNDGTAVD